MLNGQTSPKTKDHEKRSPSDTRPPVHTQREAEGVVLSTSQARESLPHMQQPALLQEYRPIIGIPIPVLSSSDGPVLLADAVGAWAVEQVQGRALLIPIWPF